MAQQCGRLLPRLPACVPPGPHVAEEITAPESCPLACMQSTDAASVCPRSGSAQGHTRAALPCKARAALAGPTYLVSVVLILGHLLFDIKTLIS